MVESIESSGWANGDGLGWCRGHGTGPAWLLPHIGHSSGCTFTPATNLSFDASQVRQVHLTAYNPTYSASLVRISSSSGPIALLPLRVVLSGLQGPRARAPGAYPRTMGTCVWRCASNDALGVSYRFLLSRHTRSEGAAVVAASDGDVGTRNALAATFLFDSRADTSKIGADHDRRGR
jgi:hypothetical protein